MMKKYLPRPWLALLLALLTLPAATAWGQSLTWQQAFSPGSCQPNRNEQSTAVDAAGNVYMVGTLGDSVSFGGPALTGEGIFVVKLSSTGVPQWMAKAEGQLFGNGLAVDGSGNVYLTGDLYSATATFGATTLTNNGPGVGSSDLFVAKLSPAGAWGWALNVGNTASESGRALGIDSSGDIYLTGIFSGYSVTFGGITLANNNQSASSQDVFVARLTPTGSWVWAVKAGGSDGGDYVRAMAVDAGGNVYITGRYPESGASYGPFSLTGSSGVSSTDLFVAKLNAAGIWQWAIGAGGDNQEVGTGIAVDGTSAVYLTGDIGSATTFGTTTLTPSGTPGMADVFVARLTTGGTWLWATSGGGRNVDQATAIAVDASGAVYITGYFRTSATPAVFGTATLTSNGLADLFVAKLSPAGAWLGAVGAGGAGEDLATSLAVAGSGQVAVVGNYGFIAFPPSSTTATFGSTVVAAPVSGQSGTFLARLATTTGLLADALTAALSLSPNPARESVTLTGATDAPAMLLDALGRTVRAYPAGTTTLDLRGLTLGLYTVRAGAATRRLVVE